MAEQDKDKDKAPRTPTRSASPPDHTDPAAAAVVNRGDLDQTDPAAAALTTAREAEEREQLEGEKKKLLDRLGVEGESMPLPALRAYVDALRQAAARAGGAKRFAHMPAGVAADIERQGYAVDVDGSTYVREGEQVFRIQRGSGEREAVDMPVPPDSAQVLGVEAGRPSEKAKA